MGWLQETIQNAFKQRQAVDDSKTSAQLAIEVQRRAEEENRLSEIRKKKDELWQQLIATGAESLLKDVKKRVWHDGRIVYEAWSHYPGYSYGLGNFFGVITREDDRPVDGWEIRLEHEGFVGVGIFEREERTVLEKQEEQRIEEAKKRNRFKRSILTGTDSKRLSVLPSGRYFVLRSDENYHPQKDGRLGIEVIIPADDTNLPGQIKDFLKKDCERRIFEHRLPRDLKKVR